jgi:hypothetical protein
VCWGALNQNERLTLLDERIKAWTSLFDVREFRFETVAQAAVLPALVLNPDQGALDLLETLRDEHALAAVCQLAGRFTKPDRPLRYQRLQSDRALLNLSRLPVPCRTDEGEKWLPAYRVYFGADWILDESVERIANAIPPEETARPEFSYLAPPERFVGLLDGPDATATGPDPGSDGDEVEADEDADQAIETDEHDRWIAFLSWIGVNRALRPVHFHDVEDDATGWLTTRNLAQPRGWAFRDLGDTWADFETTLRATLAGRNEAKGTVPYLYDAHDLDQIVPLVQAARKDADGDVARALMEHLVRHWSLFAAFADCQLALVEKDKSPSQRAKPQRALAEELTVVGDNLWLHRLRRRAICPTTHGPRVPSVTWQPSGELERRFGRGRRSSGELLPVLELSEDLPRHAIHSLAERLGVRAEPSPSTFGLEDARLLCRRLETHFSAPGRPIGGGQLRDIKPVYRELFQLLSGHSGDTAGAGGLADAPLLADTRDGLRFEPAGEILYAGTPGMRERSGVAGTVPTFVLEAEPAATAPLTRLFSVRTLEDALEWHPQHGVCPFDDAQMGEVREGLRALLPPLLARIRVERTSANDSRVLMEFVERVEPVLDLKLTCTLDGVRLDQVAERPYFVDASPPHLRRAFVVWDESRTWPPPPDAAQGLAMALADALGINLVETFLAFIQSNDTQRRRLLEIAGGAAMLGEVEHELADAGGDIETPPDHDAEDETGLDRTTAPDTDAGDERAARGPTAPSRALPPVPLVRFEDLTIDGDPIAVAGETPRDREGRGRGDGSGPNGEGSPVPPRRAAAGTDLGALDALGMRITMAYEVRRLMRAGLADAQALIPGVETDATSLVVDVHSPETIRDAEQASSIAATVLGELELQGVSRLYPGFDVLVIADGAPDRLIELKSSGVDAYVQTMSWNEWKSAKASHLRRLFWLYLVGNLRADLATSTPFVRAISDPFGSLVADVVQEQQVRRAVQLRVREFSEAEHLDLGVGAPA